MKRIEQRNIAMTDEEELYESLTEKQRRFSGAQMQRSKSSIKSAGGQADSGPEKGRKGKSGTKGSIPGRKAGRTALSFIAALLVSAGAVAQSGLQVGVQGVPQMSWLMNSDDRDNGAFEYLPTINGAFGLTLQYGFTDNFGIGLDGLYSMQGQRYELDGIEYYKRIDYIKIPLMFTYSTSLSSSVMLLGKIGPQAGILIDAKLQDKDGDEVVSNQSAGYMDYDIGGVAMLGAGFNLSEVLILETSLRYDFGFTDAEDKDYHRSLNDPDAPTNGVNEGRAVTNNMTAGVNIGLKYLIQWE